MEVKQMHFYVPKIQRKRCFLKCPKSFILLAFWYEFKHKIDIPNHKPTLQNTGAPKGKLLVLN